MGSLARSLAQARRRSSTLKLPSSAGSSSQRIDGYVCVGRQPLSNLVEKRANSQDLIGFDTTRPNTEP